MACKLADHQERGVPLPTRVRLQSGITTVLRKSDVRIQTTEPRGSRDATERIPEVGDLVENLRIVEDYGAAQDFPLTVPLFAEIPIPATHHLDTIRGRKHHHVHHRSLPPGSAAVHVDQRVGDVVVGAVFAALLTTVGPFAELVSRSVEGTVVVRRFRPEGRLHRLDVLSVHGAAVESHVLVQLLFIE